MVYYYQSNLIRHGNSVNFVLFIQFQWGVLKFFSDGGNYEPALIVDN